MSWCWLALVHGAVEGAVASATVTDRDGTPAGTLAAWHRDAQAPDGAAKVDARAIDPDGAAAVASLVLPPAGVSLPFDDPAVSQALRNVVQARPVDVVTTMTLSDDRFVGALTAVRGDDRSRLADDPFAALFPARIVTVGPGLLGRTPPPTGPSVQRYGAGNPWPWDRFGDAGADG